MSRVRVPSPALCKASTCDEYPKWPGQNPGHNLGKMPRRAVNPPRRERPSLVMHFRKGGSNMARNAKPWYNGERNCWMAYLNGRKVRLADGKGNRKAAQARLTELRFQAQLNPAP